MVSGAEEMARTSSSVAFSLENSSRLHVNAIGFQTVKCCGWVQSTVFRQHAKPETLAELNRWKNEWRRLCGFCPGLFCL